MKLGEQLSNAEWMISAGDGGSRLGRCVNCHTIAAAMFSRHDAEAMAKVVQRMGAHSTNSSIAHPWFKTDALERLAKPPSEDDVSLGAYIASINLSNRDAWPFDLMT
ncbi:MAG: hypothetical protein IH808_07485, partial [Proteobacteria bacterium]|nr:hypothetical protein [Pseudomonadota bacterium]